MLPFTYIHSLQNFYGDGMHRFCIKQLPVCKDKTRECRQNIYIYTLRKSHQNVIMLGSMVANSVLGVWGAYSFGTIRSKHRVLDVVYGKCWWPQTISFLKIATFFFFFYWKGSVRSHEDVVRGSLNVHTYSTTLNPRSICSEWRHHQHWSGGGRAWTKHCRMEIMYKPN